MMTRFIPFIFLLLFYSGVLAQTTITKASFPSTGDTLKTVFDGMPTGIMVGAGGTDQNWNFNSLQGLTRETVLFPATDGGNFVDFPSADIFTKLDPVGELYFNKTDTKYEQLGYSGLDPAGLGINVLVKFSPPILDRRAPMNYNDIKTTDYSIKLPFGADQIPGGILDSLPITPDSIRVRVDASRFDVVDGWGKLTIPGGTYEVLREKRIEIRETFIDTKINPLPWFDITDLVLGAFPFLGKDTTVNYYYYSEGTKEPIAVVNVDPNTEEVMTVEYKANDVVNNVNYVNRGKADVLAYPNPAIEEVRLEFLNLKKGDYRLAIYNILGVEVWHDNYRINSDRTVKIDLSDFRKGTYLYSLTDEKGKTITTKRLIILRP